ncbi:hypothetical protein BDF20DRAFT_933980 [Mycotypha africana]|uniref:uncharacterized protein n=1 Tax=Mycotypha africana TaxID=64632 RepID=UPI002300E5E6|nr:uncharacterized protein BDF20DRAFT_933980 [Mycotypha africana]KAI8984060.1 hypothetical protein BDF20DRAFT_933980 [Mycotypha africana]
MSQLSRLLTKTCDYAIIIQVSKVRLSTTQRGSKVVVSAEMDLNLPETTAINNSNTLTTGCFKVGANGLCDVDTPLCYFLSEKEFFRLWKENTTVRLHVKKHINAATEAEVARFDIGLSSSERITDETSEGRIDRINQYLEVYDIWHQPTVSSLDTAIQERALTLQAGIFYANMSNLTYTNVVIDKQMAAAGGFPVTASTAHDIQKSLITEQRYENMIESNGRQHEPQKKFQGHSNNNKMNSIMLPLYAAMKKCNNAIFYKGSRNRYGSILDFDSTEVYAILRTNENLLPSSRLSNLHTSDGTIAATTKVQSNVSYRKTRQRIHSTYSKMEDETETCSKILWTLVPMLNWQLQRLDQLPATTCSLRQRHINFSLGKLFQYCILRYWPHIVHNNSPGSYPFI